MEQENKSSVSGTEDFIYRINSQLKYISTLNVFLLKFFREQSLYGYQLKFESLRNILLDIEYLLNPEERKQTNKELEDLMYYVYGKEVVATSRPDYSSPLKQFIRFDNWNLVRKQLDNFERKIRKHLYEHDVLLTRRDKQKVKQV